MFLHDFEAAALPVFDSNTVSKIVSHVRIFMIIISSLIFVFLKDILIIDEIGKMELFSQKFRNEVVKSFFETSNRLFIIATIPQMHKIPQQHSSLFQKFRTDEKCKIITVNYQNRNNLPEEIFSLIL